MNSDKKTFFTYNNKTAIQLSLFISTTMILIMGLSLFYAQSRNLERRINISEILTIRIAATFLVNTILLFLLFSFQFWVLKKPQKNHRKRILLMILGSILLLFVFSPVFAQIQWWVFDNSVVPTDLYFTLHFVKDLVFLFVTLLFTALVYMWNQGQKTQEENQRLTVENIQNRYNALKSQVDPHFLFNSLNTLNGLIGFDDEKAHNYVAQLSSVFRYTMQSKPVSQLSDELEFIKSYSYLMKIRYNDSLSIEYNVDEKYLSYIILPFGLQLLIENAVKHNVVSNKYPLTIKVDVTEEEIIRVENNVQPKHDSESGGLGLVNLNERYQLMFNKEIKILQTEDVFVVEIPLIKEVESKKIESISDYESRCRRR